MVAQANWRNPETYRYLENLNPAELAWEFLRRNPDYQREVATSGPLDERATAALTAHWGLRFPDTSRPTRQERRHLLEPRRRPGRNHSGANKRAGPAHGNNVGRSGHRQTS